MLRVFKQLTEARRSIERSKMMQRLGRARYSIQQNAIVRQLALAPRSAGRRLLTALVIALAAAIVALIVPKVPWLKDTVENLDNAIYDSFYLRRTPESRITSPVVMIVVDDYSID